MSQDPGRQSARHHMLRKPSRPSLDRPSLFTDTENQDSVLDDDLQRVRILSTLESARRPQRHASSQSRRAQRKGNAAWQAKVLIGLMGAGILALLGGFVLVVMDGHSQTARMEEAMRVQVYTSGDGQNLPASNPAQQAAPVAGTAPSGNPLAALGPRPAGAARADQPFELSLAASAAQPAVIENVSSAQASAPKEAPAAPAIRVTLPTLPANSWPKPAPTAQSDTAAVAPLKQAPTSGVPPQAAGNGASARAGHNASRANQHTRTDEDVALLEAMFAHTGPRKKPAVNVSEQLKTQCGGLAGASAATCRARICVQNPSAAECHQDH